MRRNLAHRHIPAAIVDQLREMGLCGLMIQRSMAGGVSRSDDALCVEELARGG